MHKEPYCRTMEETDLEIASFTEACGQNSLQAPNKKAHDPFTNGTLTSRTPISTAASMDGAPRQGLGTRWRDLIQRTGHGDECDYNATQSGFNDSCLILHLLARVYKSTCKSKGVGNSMKMVQFVNNLLRRRYGWSYESGFRGPDSTVAGADKISLL